jgi:hypothetical protein
MDIREAIIEKCPFITEEANYWLVRTDAGSLFSPFLDNDVISIGYPKITKDKIYECVSTSPEKTIQNLKILAAGLYPDHERPGLIASQIYRFTFEIKKGDYVLIPDLNTDKLAIGIVDGETLSEDKLYMLRGDESTLIPEFNKLKKIKWMKTVVKRHINPNVYKLFSCHQTIANANDYSRWVDSMLYDFYRKGDEYHIVLDIPKPNIPAITLFECYRDLFKLVEKYCKENQIQESLLDISVSINLNSPGKVEFLGRIALGIFIAGAFVVCINGGNFKLKVEKAGLDAEISTPGIIKNINDFLNSGSDRQLKKGLFEKVNALEIKNPEDLTTLINEI